MTTEARKTLVIILLCVVDAFLAMGLAESRRHRREAVAGWNAALEARKSDQDEARKSQVLAQQFRDLANQAIEQRDRMTEEYAQMVAACADLHEQLRAAQAAKERKL